MSGSMPSPAVRGLVLSGNRALPALIVVAGERAARRFLEFFAASIRDPHTRRAYGRTVGEVLAWCDD
jgi:hypothetical protein